MLRRCEYSAKNSIKFFNILYQRTLLGILNLAFYYFYKAFIFKRNYLHIYQDFIIVLWKCKVLPVVPEGFPFSNWN